MKTNVKIRSYFSLLILSSAVCSAILPCKINAVVSNQDNNNATFTNKILNDGIFVDFKVGASKIQSPNENLLNSTDASHREISPAMGANLGYLYFNTDYLFTDIQLGFNYYGESVYKGSFSDGSSEKTGVSQYDLDMLFGAGLASDMGLNIGVKAGVARVTQTFKDRSGDAYDSLQDRDNFTRYRPKAELDLGYIIDSNADLVLAYSRIFGTSEHNFPVSNNSIMTNNTLMLSLIYVLPE